MPAPTGQAAAGRVNALMLLIHHPPHQGVISPLGSLALDPNNSTGRPPLDTWLWPLPSGGGRGGEEGEKRKQSTLFAQFNPIASPNGQCLQCRSAGLHPIAGGLKPRPLRSPGLKLEKENSEVLAPSPTNSQIRSQQLRPPPPASVSPINQNSFIMPISSFQCAADSCQQK